MIIRARNLSKTYFSVTRKVNAVSNLNLDIEKGEIVGLLGPNGAGKTTSINLLSTIIKPTEGGAIVNGRDILLDDLEVRRSIGIVPDNPGFYKRLTASQNLNFYGAIYGTAKELIDERKEKYLKQFDLQEVENQKVGGFSKGMKQKLSIVKALINDPEILIFDEPWSGLSPEAQRELRDFLLGLTSGKERTVIITTHNLRMAEELITRAVIINHGRLLLDKSIDELRRDGKATLTIQLELSNSDQNQSIISKYGEVLDHEVKENRSYFTLKMKDEEIIPNLIETLVHNKIKVYNVARRSSSLEDVYFEVIGNQEESE